MSNNELLTIEHKDLQFIFELEKQISCSLYLMNKTDNNVAFKVMITNPKNYSVRPNIGFVLRRSTCEVIVTMKGQKEAPFDMQCKDKFLIQGVKAGPGVTAKEVTRQMFNKEAGHLVEETKLRVTYVCYATTTITCSSKIRRRFSFTSNTLSDVSCYGVGAACHELGTATGKHMQGKPIITSNLRFTVFTLYYSYDLKSIKYRKRTLFERA